MDKIKSLFDKEFKDMSKLELKSFIFLCRIEAHLIRNSIGINPNFSYGDFENLSKKQLINIAQMSIQLTF